jgi:cytochrome c55X
MSSRVKSRLIGSRMRCRWSGHARAALASLLLTLATTGIATAATQDNDPTPQRQQKLVRMVRQDCGSCHGLHLTGGLGPALTPAALRDWSVAGLAATILHGRPGTPMPPWKTFVSEPEADWIARRLREGFPQESGSTQ